MSSDTGKTIQTSDELRVWLYNKAYVAVCDVIDAYQKENKPDYSVHTKIMDLCEEYRRRASKL